MEGATRLVRKRNQHLFPSRYLFVPLQSRRVKVAAGLWTRVRRFRVDAKKGEGDRSKS